eukprot:1126223-Rhodomonas_salina.1
MRQARWCECESSEERSIAPALATSRPAASLAADPGFHCRNPSSSCRHVVTASVWRRWRAQAANREGSIAARLGQNSASGDHDAVSGPDHAAQEVPLVMRARGLMRARVSLEAFHALFSFCSLFVSRTVYTSRRSRRRNV